MTKKIWNDFDKLLVAIHIASASPRYSLSPVSRVLPGKAMLIPYATFGFIMGIVLGAVWSYLV